MHRGLRALAGFAALMLSGCVGLTVRAAIGVVGRREDQP